MKKIWIIISLFTVVALLAGILPVGVKKICAANFTGMDVVNYALPLAGSRYESSHCGG